MNGGFTTAGLRWCKNGFSPFAQTAVADVPMTPPSLLFGAAKFVQPIPRLAVAQVMRSTETEGRSAVTLATTATLAAWPITSILRQPC